MSEPIKRCADCGPRPISDFGVNAVNLTAGLRDGLNIRCRDCMNAKTRQHRETLRAAPKAVHRKRSIVSRARPKGHKARILWALQRGAKAQVELCELTQIREDELCDLLAELAFDTQQICIDRQTRRFRLAA